MKKVFICSPYRGNITENEAKALTYCWRAVAKGYLPYAPHLYFTQLLDDNNPTQRDAGINAGLEWLRQCDEVWAFGTITDGMRIEIAEAEQLGIKVVRFDA